MKPGFDFNRWLLALSRVWYLFFVSVFLGVAIFYFLFSITPKRYDLNAAFFVTKDVETELYGAELRLPLLRLYAKRNNVENHIGILKSNQMLYDCLLEQERHLSFKGTKENKSPTFQITFPMDKMPVEIEYTLEHLNEDSCLITITGGEKRIMTVSSGYMERIVLLKRTQFKAHYGEPIDLIHYSLIINKINELTPGLKQVIRTNNLRRTMGDYDQRVRIKTLNKRATILSIGVSTATPKLDMELLNLLMNKTIAQRKKQEKELALRTVKGLRDEFERVLVELDDLTKERERIKISENTTLLNASIRSILTEINEIGVLRDKYQLEKETVKKSMDELLEYDIAIFPSTLIDQDPSIIIAIREYHSLISEYESLKVLSGENNPSLKKHEAKVRYQKEYILERLINRNSQLDLLLQYANTREKELEISLNNLPYLERTLGHLNRTITYREKEAKKLQKKIAEVSMAANYESTVFKVLEEAVLKKKPFAPLNAEGFIVTILIVLFFPVILVFADSYRGSRIYSDAQIEQLITDRPIASLHRFIFSLKHKFKYENNGKRINEEFRIFIKEVLFSVNTILKRDSGIVLGFYPLHTHSSGLALTTNLSKAMISMHRTTLQITIEHNEGILPTDNARSVLNQLKGDRLVLNSIWLDQTKLLEELLNMIRKTYHYSLISLPQKMPDERRAEFSQYTDFNLGLIKEHFTREHNVIIFKEVLERLSSVPVKMIYISGHIKKFRLIKPVRSHYEYDFTLIDHTFRYARKSIFYIKRCFKSFYLHTSRK